MDYLRRVPLEILRNDTPRWLLESCSYPVWARAWFCFAWCARILVKVCVCVCRSKVIRCLLNLADLHRSNFKDVTAVYYMHWQCVHSKHFLQKPSTMTQLNSVWLTDLLQEHFGANCVLFVRHFVTQRAFPRVYMYQCAFGSHLWTIDSDGFKTPWKIAAIICRFITVMLSRGECLAPCSSHKSLSLVTFANWKKVILLVKYK